MPLDRLPWLVRLAQASITTYVPSTFPWLLNNMAIALSPFLGYLLIFKYYTFLRDATGISAVTQPNLELLPWMEEVR